MAEDKMKIMFVDDDPDFQQVLKDRLEYLGFNVVQETDDRKAVLRAVEENPDIIFLDVMMPWKNGYQIACDLKGNQVTKNTPLVFVSGVHEDLFKELGKGIYGDGFIEKGPDSIDEIIHIIRETVH